METILNSALISKYISQEKIDAYGKDLKDWLDKNDLWGLLGMADHFAIKVENEKALHAAVEAIKPYCTQQVNGTPGLSIRKMQNRLIATTLLRHPLHIGFNLIYCVEIMEPVPEALGKDIVGLDHLEFINADFEGVQDIFREKKIDYTIDTTNGYKKTTMVKINNRGERVKFTDKTLAEIVPLQINDDPDLVTVVLPVQS